MIIITAGRHVKECCKLLLRSSMIWTCLTGISLVFLWRLIVFSCHIMPSFFPSTLTVLLIGFVMMFLTNLFQLITSFMQACQSGTLPGRRLWRVLKVFVVELCSLVVYWGSAKPGRRENSGFIIEYFVKCVLSFSKLKHTRKILWETQVTPRKVIMKSHCGSRFCDTLAFLIFVQQGSVCGLFMLEL